MNKRERIVLTFAGTFVLASSLLGFFLNKNWLFVTMFVGLNLFQFSLTKFCPLEKILERSSKNFVPRRASRNGSNKLGEWRIFARGKMGQKFDKALGVKEWV